MDNKKKTAKAEDTSVETDTQAQESSGPIWKTQSGRVQSAIWKHEQKGKVRYTISVSRSYKDQGDVWHNVHFFDQQDLRDVVTVANEARDEVQRLGGTTSRLSET